MAHLSLDTKKIDYCRKMAERISKPIEEMIHSHTTVAIERATLRLLGVNGRVKKSGQ